MTEEVPIRPAATVMLLDDRPELQIFMMQRNVNTVFAGGMWVFPGGSVDIEDDPRHFEEMATHRNDIEASALLDMPAGGLAYYVAAIREAFEEAGVLLALHSEDESPLELASPERRQRFKQYRDLVNANSNAFADCVREENLLLDVGKMHYVARWITPPGPPRRFDARFFIARMPRDQEPIHDDSELVHSEWLAPQDILEREQAGEMTLMAPTLRMVRSLASFDSAEAAIMAAAANLPDERVRATPDHQMMLPGDEGYDAGDDNVEAGWVRFRPLAEQ